LKPLLGLFGREYWFAIDICNERASKSLELGFGESSSYRGLLFDF